MLTIGSSVIKERRRIDVAVLKFFVDFAVHAVSARLGDDADVRSTIGSLSGVVHGGVYRDFLNGFRRGSGQGLADSGIDRVALDLTAGAEILARIQDEAVLAHLTGGVSVKEIVGTDAVQREAIAEVSRCPLAKMAWLPSPVLVPDPPRKSA